MLETTFWLVVAEWCVRIVFSLRVIMRRESVETSLAWLTIILLVPFVGAVVYFLVGEKRLGHYRMNWAKRLVEQHDDWRQRLWKHKYANWEGTSDPAQLSRLIAESTMSPPMSGNCLQLMDSADEIFRCMINDIQQAKECCFLEYYIWEVGGLANDIAAALFEASQRGVDCRVLVDAVGSRGFLRSQHAKTLEKAGVQIRAALPANIFRALFYRFDLRLHRKIAVFDRKIAYVGSQNMADPKLFQAGAGFGQWIDAMVRVKGPAVDALSMIFSEDWQLESLQRLSPEEIPGESEDQDVGSAPIQVIPSGPGLSNKAIQQTLINAIYMADTRLFLTTPYFVPDEPLQSALLSAVHRGVDVTIIIPEKVNSRFVELTSRAFLRELIEAGVTVARYQSGMLHTKSVVVDDDTCMFGSLNLDPRSLHLNFEITLAIFDADFVGALASLQQKYLRDSRLIVQKDIATGSIFSQIIENCVRLLSPLL